MWKLYGNCTHLFDNVYLVDFIVTLMCMSGGEWL